MTIPHRDGSTVADTNEIHPDVVRVAELHAAVESTHRALRAAESAYQLAARDSAYDDLDDDPHVLATREAMAAARRAHAAASDRLDEVLSFGPVLLAAGAVTPQSRRSLERWSASRGGGEVLSIAVRQIVAALAHGRTVKVEVI
jgi:hypothetical protein